MEARAKLHLREWLIGQIDSCRYEGLCWEDEDKSMFRIPWKHAAKKDYRQREDAALFKAWAVYKGKYREGRDQADPTMWKTRLRCALNKSSDFEEVPERNQLDITEPYKVYRILPEPREESMQRREVKSLDVDSEEEDDCYPPKESTDSLHKERTTGNPLREHMYCEVKENTSANLPQASVSFFSHGNNISDVRMHVTLLYQGVAVLRVTTRSPDGCFILQGSIPPANEKIYGSCTAQQLSFPSPAHLPLPPGLAHTMDRLLCHLERGVLLWVAPEGVFIKRFCQGRVYWSGPQAKHADRPNKLERDKTFKLLDVPLFRSQLQRCVQQKGPLPLYKIELCFGEEYPDPNVSKAKKLIMAEVVPVFAEELLQQLHLQDSGDTGDTEDRSTESFSQSETEH